jgi:hypothetical protein
MTQPVVHFLRSIDHSLGQHNIYFIQIVTEIVWRWLADDPVKIQYGCCLSALAGFSNVTARRQPRIVLPRIQWVCKGNIGLVSKPFGLFSLIAAGIFILHKTLVYPQGNIPSAK